MSAFQPTATPMRQVPGAFFNTPAPTRANDAVQRRLFERTPSQTSLGARRDSSALTSTSNGGLEAVNQSQAPEAPLPPILKAARSVNRVLQLDESFPDLDTYCRGKF
jgi:nuclear pore complex protein Nup155